MLIGVLTNSKLFGEVLKFLAPKGIDIKVFSSPETLVRSGEAYDVLILDLASLNHKEDILNQVRSTYKQAKIVISSFYSEDDVGDLFLNRPISADEVRSLFESLSKLL